MVRQESADVSNELWTKLPWKQFRRNLIRLQKRIYRATKDGDLRKVRSLQKLVMKSTSAIMLAIRQVTQLNTGKKTAGIDRKKCLKFHERFLLLWELEDKALNWKHQGLRSIPIPKKKRWFYKNAENTNNQRSRMAMSSKVCARTGS